MAELAGVMVGNYFLLECLSREGMVEIYRARPTTRGGCDVVLCLFRPGFPDTGNFREHFAEEVEKVWQCSHPTIQPLLEFGTGDELLYYVTALPEADSLEQLLKEHREQHLPLELVVSLVLQLCSALQYIHERGIVHGNIQPSSIFLNKASEVLLTYFRMRRAYQHDDPLIALFEEGNPLYAAPEQGLGILRPTSDIYALGALLFHLLAGVPPYVAEFSDEVAFLHMNEPIPTLRVFRADVPESLELVVRVALAKTPEARFPSVQALGEALVEALTPRGSTTIFEAQKRVHVRSRRRMHVAWMPEV